MNKDILLKVKIQAIYFQTPENELGIQHATSEKRITIAEAEDILIDRKVEFVEVLKVKYEDIEIEIPLSEYENYIVGE